MTVVVQRKTTSSSGDKSLLNSKIKPSPTKFVVLMGGSCFKNKVKAIFLLSYRMSATRLVVLASIFVTLVACTRIYLDDPKPVTVPTEWISMGAANAEHEIKFLIALKQRNIEQLEQILA